MTRRTARRAGIAAALLAVLQAVTGLAGPVGAAADGCAVPQRIFAVDAGTGHLSELEACKDPASITVVGDVDDGDWRSAERLLATTDGATTVVYAITADGRLEARRQDAPGAALGMPVQVGSEIDWSLFRAVIALRPGYLLADDGNVRMFRHVDWSGGGSTLVEGPAPITRRGGYPTLGDLALTGWSGHAGAFFMNTHWRIWNGSDGGPIAYPNGAIPRDVLFTTLTGSEPNLYGVANGSVVRLKQPPHPPPTGKKNYICPFNTMSWQVTSSLPGTWATVVVPKLGQPSDAWPGVSPFPTYPPRTTWTCPEGIGPYQWQ